MNVSIIVSVYNGADVLGTTLPSLLDQDYSPDKLQIIVVNDASTDGSAELLSFPEWAGRCQVIHHETNEGRCATRNSGLGVATGDLVIFVDCDIEVAPDLVSRHVERHADSEVVGLLSNLQPSAPLQQKYHRYLFHGRRGARTIGGERPLPYRYFILTATSIKRSALEKTGEFKPELRGYGIDLHYAYRLWKNFPDNLFYAPDIMVKQHKLKSISQALSDFRDYGTRNLPIILEEFPELGESLGIDYVDRSLVGGWGKGIAGALLFNSLTREMGRLLTALLPSPLCNTFIRYRMVEAVVSGYRTHLSQRE